MLDDQARVASGVIDNNEWKPLKLKINGVVVEADVHIPTMKNALGLPPHDMFQDGIFYHGFNPQPQSNPLMEDVDHLMEENV